MCSFFKNMSKARQQDAIVIGLSFAIVLIAKFFV
jgi:hypothetical protein